MVKVFPLYKTDLYFTEGPQWNYIYFLEKSQLTNFVVINLVSLKNNYQGPNSGQGHKIRHKNKAISLEKVTSACAWARS